ncbi:inosine/xanthosine triphosphatase [Chondrinema litorale]|uniref:inosine/xanthosine triphosphatase n=1 Tax=Chondrinema litorale TaxID=2994555 RepID=UPI0025446DEB|nr:inosine/xanthosine triphosphatase [Chondrinema litorale]UZR93565.1 inosine/xanthosine triphosphatase [Chondrinema litorale]
MIQTNKYPDMEEVIITSKNPVKINATVKAFETLFKNVKFTYKGVSVASEVPDQPIGYDETLKGAENRVKNAKKQFTNAAYWIGIEGGVHGTDEMEVFAWVYIESRDGFTGKAKTSTFYLPPAITELVNKGYELGHADDIVFKKQNSKQQGGSVGLLTHGIVDRQSYYEQAVILSMIPFINKELFT